MLRTFPGFATSTIGESPVTVTLSCSVPSAMLASTWNVAPARTTMPSRRKPAKLASSPVSVYVPGGRLIRRYCPTPSVTATLGASRAGLVAVTVTPGSAPP